MNALVLLMVLMCSFVGPSYQILCSKSCGVNEVFSECGAGAGECQKTCLTRRRTEDLGCDCVAGCICKDGYYRDANTYKCISRRKCPSLPVPVKSCPKNEVYSESLAGCQKTCYTQDRQYKCIPKSGCICRNGYFRCPITNKCISKKSCEQCPSNYKKDPETNHCVLSCQTCSDPNAEFNQCASSCQPTCDKPVTGICNRMCNVGCYCKKGYIQDPKGKCILPEQCVKPNCPANELLFCRNPTCDDEGCYKMGRACQNVPCEVKCYCKEGYVRIDGKCVPRTQCKSPIDVIDPIIIVDPIIIIDPIVECIPNASYTKCGSSCAEFTCEDRTKANVVCPYLCEEGCFCRKGYFKNYDGLCVLPENCPPKCPDNEFFSCGSAGCEENCDNIGIKCTIVNITCDKKCFCKDGFIREFRNGPCISTNQCPRRHVETNSNFVNPQKMD